MKYISTRGYDQKFTAAQAITLGIAPDGGLFVHKHSLLLQMVKLKRYYQYGVLSNFGEGYLDVLDDYSEVSFLSTHVQRMMKEKWGNLCYSSSSNEQVQ